MQYGNFTLTEEDKRIQWERQEPRRQLALDKVKAFLAKNPQLREIENDAWNGSKLYWDPKTFEIHMICYIGPNPRVQPCTYYTHALTYNKMPIPNPLPRHAINSL